LVNQVKQETIIKMIRLNLYEFKKQTSSENSSSEQSVDNDVVAVKVSYTKNKESRSIFQKNEFYFRWIN